MTLRLFYGGTFDPVHNGHLAIARAAHDAMACPVRLMPAADPPHRAAPGADALQRVTMLELAMTGQAGLCVDRRELERGGRSYSIDTVRALRVEFGDAAPLALLVGADSFIALPTWKDWRELLECVHFVVAERPGNPLDGTLPDELEAATASRWAVTADDLVATSAGRVLRLRQRLHDESATEIRRLIATGGPWRERVPAPVADYISEEGLYRGDGHD